MTRRRLAMPRLRIDRALSVLTVAVLATLAVSARGLAVRLAGEQSAVAAGVLKAIEVTAALAVLLLGLLLLGGALSRGWPG